MTPPNYLIIGNGAAGMSAAEAIRQRDAGGRITLVTDEPYLFYSRPGIAYYAMGQIEEGRLIARGASFYAQHRFELLHGRVAAIDFALRRAMLEDGSALPYDALLLATGSLSVPAAFPGSELEGLLGFDCLDDARRVLRAAGRARGAVVVGGGITAMELAEALRHQGLRVHWLQRQERIWPRLFNEHESALVAAQARHKGVEILYREEIAEALGQRGRVAGVRLRGGRELPCQIVGVAIGTRPNTRLLKGSALHVDQGVVVDDFMQTSLPGVFAAGDVAQVYDRWTGKHQLDTLWPSALAEGRNAGYNMVDAANGRALTSRYAKAAPFNACLLFGVHITVIGRLGDSSRGGEVEEVNYASRGASNVWVSAFGPPQRSAWDGKGPDSLRVAMANGRIVGALLVGNQELADPLRALVENEVDLSAQENEILSAGTNLPAVLQRISAAL